MTSIKLVHFHLKCSLSNGQKSCMHKYSYSILVISRLTPPLCLNFLSMIHMDSHVIKSTIEETAYTRIMGHMDVISIVSDYFNIYFPIALLALTLATYFSLGARLLTMLGFQQFLGMYILYPKNIDSRQFFKAVSTSLFHFSSRRRSYSRACWWRQRTHQARKTSPTTSCWICFSSKRLC